MTVNTLGIHDQDRSSRTVAEWLWPLLPIGVSVFCLSALVYYHLRHDVVAVRSAMQVFIATIYSTVGLAPAVMCCLLVLTWSSIWFATGKLERPVGRVLRLLAMTVMLGVFLNLGDGGVTADVHKGELGAWLAGRLVAAFGYVPSLVVVWIVTFASLLLATDFFFSESFERLRTRTVATDSGVEVAVTDHLRGLGTAVGAATDPARPPAASSMTVPTVEGPPSRPRDVVAVEHAHETGTEAEAHELEPTPTEQAEHEPYVRRRSYRERLREREESAAQRAPVAEPGGESPAPDEAAAHAADDDAGAEAAPVRVPAAERDLRDDVDIADEEDLDDDGNRAPAGPTGSAAATEPASSAGPGFDDLDDVFAPPAAPFGEVPQAAAFAPDEDEDDEAAATAAADAAEQAAIEADEIDELDEADEADEAEEIDAATAADELDEADEARATDEPEHDPPDERADTHAGASAEADAAEPEAEPEAPPAPSRARRRYRDADDEPVIQIPRPPAPPQHDRERDADEAAPVRQRGLFPTGLDEELVQEAIDLVTSSRRASAAMLQRKLRIDYEQAMEVLAELGARGIVALEGDASGGRVLSP